MKTKRIRNTTTAKWAEKNGCSVHKAMVYRYKLNKLIKFGCEKTPEQETFLTCLARSYYHFAVYYRQDDEWLLWGTNDHWAFWSEDEVAEFANEHLIPFYLLDDNFAKMCKVPTNAIQLLRMKKQRIK